MYINIHSFCSILSEAHLEPITASSLFWYDAISLAHLILAVLLYRTSQAPLGWRGRSQISPKIFSKVQAWVLAWALKEIHKGVPKHSFVILVVGSGFCPLGADDPSHQSEVKSSLDVSVHCCVHLSLNSDYSLSSCCWKTSLQQCCHRHAGMVLARWWGVPGFLQIGRLVFRPKSSNFVPSDQRIFISHSLKIFQVTFGKLSVGSHAYITEERRGVECCRTLWEFSSLSNAWVLSEGPPSSLSPPWLRPFYPGNWDWTASFIKCLAGSKLITFTSEGGRCAYWEI